MPYKNTIKQIATMLRILSESAPNQYLSNNVIKRKHGKNTSLSPEMLIIMGINAPLGATVNSSDDRVMMSVEKTRKRDGI